MRYLLNSLVQIALLRKDPSILPASIVLLLLTAAIYAVASALVSWMQFGPDRLFQRTTLDLGLTLAIVWLMLAAAGHGNRFRQVATAILAVDIVFASFLAGIFLLQLAAGTDGGLRFLVGASSIAVLVWYTLALGHILRSALEIGFVASIAIALTWVVAAIALARRLFPVAT